MKRSLVILSLVACAGACSSGGAGTLAANDGGAADGSTPRGDAGGAIDGSRSGPVMIDAADFDQSCTRDDDCELVFSGDLCAGCHCANATIAKSANAQYNDARTQLTSQCPPQDVGIGCACAASPPPACEGGRCTLNPTPHDAGADG